MSLTDIFLTVCILGAGGMFCAAFAVLLIDPPELRHDI